ncbi:MAG: hypothetical protein BVN29_06965 [Nitrospira sp. ST-bin5]|nr:MAG: hypothetical protein BVN29_06965 [Nitrospira sp. ST-bin5]
MGLKMLNYHHEISERITNRAKWPNFERSDFLIELNAIAEDSFLHKTIDGYLGALLIYHQLAEEILKLLLEDSQFLIQLRVYPAPIRFPQRRRQMFGNLLDELESTLDFELKPEIIEYARGINDRRIRLVHGLTRESSTENIDKDIRWVKSCFTLLFDCFSNAHHSFLQQFEAEQQRQIWSAESH